MSIKRKLLFLMLGLFSFMSLSSAGVMFYIGKNEATEILDGNMEQIAKALSQHQAIHYFQKDDTEIDEESEFLIQIWDNNQTLIYSSHPTIDIPLHPLFGHGSQSYNGKNWRYFSTYDNDKYVQISQPTWFRNELIFELISTFIIPLLLQIPLAVFLILFFVDRGIAPLQSISEKIDQRDGSDLTKIELTKIPLEIRAIIHALNNLFDKVAQTIHLHKDFTSMAAHELKTPLTAIRLYGELLSRQDLRPEQQEILQRLQTATTRMSHLVTQMLTLTKQEALSLPETPVEPLNLSHFIQTYLAEIHVLAEDKHIKIRTDTLSPDISLDISAEDFRLILQNLLQNALMYTPPNGYIDIALSQTSTTTLLKISDNGIGIPFEDREVIFNKFYRVLGSKQNGAGLGLSIVKNILDKYNASVNISDGIQGKGSQFTLIFPS